MRDPNIVLDILSKRSINNIDISDIYPLMYKESLYLLAYNSLAQRNGMLAHSKVITEDTLDNTSMGKIRELIEDMRHERYVYNPSMDWRHTLVQELVGIILSTIYAPKFSSTESLCKDRDTALEKIQKEGKFCEFFITGNISSLSISLDTITKESNLMILNVLRQTIKDNRFIELMRKILKINRVYKIRATKSLEVLLNNICLNELDAFIENEVKVLYNNNIRRQESKKYRDLSRKIYLEEKKLSFYTNKEERSHSIQLLKDWRKQLKKTPRIESIEVSKSRKLCYTRYDKDWLISFTGTFKEALDIKEKINTFVKDRFNIKEDTNILIKPSSNKKDPAQFLDYNLITITDKINTTNPSIGYVALLIPDSIVRKELSEYMKSNKIVHLSYCTNYPIEEIIQLFQSRYRRLCQYYKLARNKQKLNYVKYVLETSLVKSLANKLKSTATKIYKKFSCNMIINGKSCKVLAHTYLDKKGNKRTAYFGTISSKIDHTKH